MTPNGVKKGKVYSIKPASGSGDFTFTRATTSSSITGIANKEASNGLIKSVAANVPRLDYSDGSCPALLLEPQSTNLIAYPVSFPNYYWNKSGASIEADASTAGVELLPQLTNAGFPTQGDGWSVDDSTNTASCDGTNAANSFLNSTNTINVIEGTMYQISITIDAISGGAITMLDVGLDETGAYDLAITEVGTFTVDRIAIGNDTTGKLTCRARTGVSVVVSNISVKEVQGFVSPDGTTNAYKLVEGTNNGQHRTTVALGIWDGSSDYTLSVFAKAGLKDLFLDSSNTGKLNARAWFNLSGNGTSNSILGTSGIELLENGWYRCWMSGTSTVAGGASVEIGLSNGDDNFYQGDGTSGVYIYGAQLEQLSYPTSLIYNGTEGSTVTRTADLCTNSGTVNDFNSAEGTIFFEAKGLNDSGPYSLISISDGTTSNRIGLGFQTGADVMMVESGGTSTSIGMYDKPFVRADNNKIALKYKANDCQLWLNGALIATDTTFSAFPSNTFNTLSLNSSNQHSFYGKLKQVQVYKEALTDTELITLTTL